MKTEINMRLKLNTRTNYRRKVNVLTAHNAKKDLTATMATTTPSSVVVGRATTKREEK